MMSCALPASWAYVPEVSTSMYTACEWLRLSTQPVAARASAGMERRNWRLFMWIPLGVRALEVDVDVQLARTALQARALHEALREQRHHDADIVQTREQPAQLSREGSGRAQDEGERAQQREEEHPAHRATRMDQRF